MKKQTFTHLLLIFISLLLILFSTLYYFLYTDKKNLSKDFSSLNKNYKELKVEKEKVETKLYEIENINKILQEKFNKTNINLNDISNLNLENNSEEIIKLKKENEELRIKLNEIISNKDLVLLNSLSIINMDIGEWKLNQNEIDKILNSLSKDKSFYEIVPIVDNKNYLNDPDELKQLGLSRKRASLAVTILRSLNPNNKIFLSTEIIVSDKNERGFIIRQYK